MKIVSGLGSIDEYISFVEAGADEFFCGYVPDCWAQKYGILQPLNRREVLYYNVQLGAMSELKILRKMVECYGVPVHLTFNSLYYTPEQYPVIADIISQCMDCGFETFIIADPALIVYLRRQKIPCRIHLSGETAEVNRSMLDLFYQFDLDRVIFHRKNSLEDMLSCILHTRKQESRKRESGLDSVAGNWKKSDKKIEFESFLLNEMCHFSGAFCNSLHCDEFSHLCHVPYWIGKVSGECYSCSETDQENGGSDLDETEMEEEEGEEQSYRTGETGCGLCALYKMREIGVTHLKLVGRGNYTDYARRDIEQVKKALDILDETDGEKSFQREMKRQLFRGECSHHCYYREKEKRD
ncbi:MAG: U32 family peptidase [Lachnospiraceae bacterium]|nr:U32 family peptidase [Lachnospiraceae bacterium]